MEAFTGHSAESCYTPLADRNIQLRFLVEQIARDTERSCSKMDLHSQTISQTDFSFLLETREKKETLRSINKHLEVIEKSCAPFSQDNLYTTMQAEEEEEESNHGDVEEHTEVVTETSRDNHDKKCPLVADHTFTHFCFDILGSSEEMQGFLIEEITWRLALQSEVEEEERERVREEVVEDEEESQDEEILDLFQGHESNSEEGRRVEDAIGVQDEDDVELEEACTGHELHVVSPPKFEELLGKDLFAVSICKTKATSTLFFLGGLDGG
ncbi:unnamed protein product [Linum trigynum]|uniref:Uncharacterized protein n=1 Tax=Linum trigynum TaxID=586398 RepID=A0AAV2FM31_9ROSI